MHALRVVSFPLGMSNAACEPVREDDMKLTVFFDGQFWVGLIERQTEDGLFVSRYIFGAEPKDKEILDFVNKRLSAILSAQTVGVSAEAEASLPSNPKRRAREAAREMKISPISTKAQEAFKLQLAENKKERRVTIYYLK